MKINFNKILFVLAYIFMLIPHIFNKVNLNSVFLYTIYLISICILIILFLYEILYKNRKIKISILIFLIIVFILSIISSICINNTIMLRTFLFICAFRNIKFDEFIKCDLIIRISSAVILFILYNLDLTNPVNAFRGDAFRYSFGFHHPNKFGLCMMLICMEITYLYFKNPDKKNKWLVIIFLSIISFIVSYFADSRASFIMMIFCIVLLIINKKFWIKIINLKFIKFFVKNLFLILTIVSFGLTILYKYDIPVINGINELSSYRLYWGDKYLKNYNVNLFGNKLMLFEEEKIIDSKIYFTLDNNYVYFTLQCGIVFLIVMIFLFKKTLKKLYETNKYESIVFLVLYIVYGFMESTLLKFYYNPFLLLFNYTLFEDDDMF